MSEYQYYEFQAIDRPLDADARAYLRGLSSRAEITATSLTNEYHFGDFKGDPEKLVERYFDAHLYYANWGSNTLLLRLPLAGLTMADVEPYLGDEDHGFTAWDTKQHVILRFQMQGDEPPDYEEDLGGSLAGLIPLRTELLAGDRRPLYLGWLLSVQQAYDEADDAAEPPVPPGLKALSGPQQALADFLDIDADLIAAAAERSAELKADPAEDADRLKWVAALPAGEKDALLVRVMGGEPVGVELQRRFRERRPASPGEVTRTAGELRERAGVLTAEREERERKRKARERDAAARRQAEAREKHLTALAGKEEASWSKVETLVAAKAASKYDEAVGLLTDLHEVARRAGASAAFAARLAALRERHATKRSFLERLDRKDLT